MKQQKNQLPLCDVTALREEKEEDEEGEKEGRGSIGQQ